MMIGGQHTVAATAKQLSPSNISCRILTIRLRPGDATRIDFSNEVNKNIESHGYLVASTTSGESWTFGPYDIGSGIRPSEIWVWGDAGEILHWNGLPA